MKREDRDYYKRIAQTGGGLGRGCGPTLMMCVILIAGILLVSGCRTVRRSVAEKEHASDSMRIEYKEKIVKVPVTVCVEVPVEQKEKVTKDSTSHLETSFAVSDAAMIWIDGVPFLSTRWRTSPRRSRRKIPYPSPKRRRLYGAHAASPILGRRYARGSLPRGRSS